MLLRPKCQQQHNQIEVALGHETVFGRMTRLPGVIVFLDVDDLGIPPQGP